jgi:hypothetical protein
MPLDDDGAFFSLALAGVDVGLKLNRRVANADFRSRPFPRRPGIDD